MWLSDYSLFRMLLEKNGQNHAWAAWPPEHRSPRLARAWLESLPPKQREPLAERMPLFPLRSNGWPSPNGRPLKAYGALKQVYLMGDIPYGVGRFSADVWANPDIFDLDWSGGAPPEKTFKVESLHGKMGARIGGVPDYRWPCCAPANFDWWRTRVGNIQKIFHL
jgi:4-alpha-glucanotransferase